MVSRRIICILILLLTISLSAQAKEKVKVGYIKRDDESVSLTFNQGSRSIQFQLSDIEEGSRCALNVFQGREWLGQFDDNMNGWGNVKLKTPDVVPESLKIWLLLGREGKHLHIKFPGLSEEVWTVALNPAKNKLVMIRNTFLRSDLDINVMIYALSINGGYNHLFDFHWPDQWPGHSEQKQRMYSVQKEASRNNHGRLLAILPSWAPDNKRVCLVHCSGEYLTLRADGGLDNDNGMWGTAEIYIGTINNPILRTQNFSWGTYVNNDWPYFKVGGEWQILTSQLINLPLNNNLYF